MRFFERAAEYFKKAPPTATPEQSPIPTSSTQERVLLERSLSGRKLLGIGTTGVEFVTLEGNGSAIFKSCSQMEQEAREKSINRERAAYLINLFLGFDFVPPTVIRKIGKERGSLQEFVEGAKTAYEQQGYEERKKLDSAEMTKLHLFDAVIANADRNDGNYLVKNGKIYAIDHGYSLEAYELESDWYCSDLSYSRRKVPEHLLGGLRNAVTQPETRKTFRQLIAELLGEDATDALLYRMGAILQSIGEDGYFDKETFAQRMRNRKRPKNV